MEKDRNSQEYEDFVLLTKGGEAELVEKKSRFIATVRPVESEEEAAAFIEEMKRSTMMPDIIVQRMCLAARRSSPEAAMTESQAVLRGALCWRCCSEAAFAMLRQSSHGILAGRCWELAVWCGRIRVY